MVERAQSVWDEVLSALEHQRALEADYLRAKGALPEPYRMPEGLGPLPPALKERAERVLMSNWAMEGLLSQARDALGRLLQVSRESSLTPPPAVFVDRMA
ncbi:MAG: hypothetical protein M1115_02750 [Actinobacteria bacterium]|nr:hypothetical protein [Actinomycetota bacterium]